MQSMGEALNKVLDNLIKPTGEYCETHGDELVLLNREGAKPFCQKCQSEKMLEENKKLAAQAGEHHKRQRTVNLLRNKSIVGDSTLWDAEFDNYETTAGSETEKALALTKSFASQYVREGKKFNAIYTGTPGAGKSHLAMGLIKMINQYSTPHVSCLFISTADLFRLIKDSFNNQDQWWTEERAVKLLTEVDYLVLDDLGSESLFTSGSKEASDFNQRVLFTILNGRTNTIVTTNHTSDELSRMYNPKIVSRILKGSTGHVVKFTEATSDKRENVGF
ncbi:ATP-binding protein [Weissella ceti]|uniref:ATP-binding protein n=1 Tax=Weissella ceti TaxID=759620 RepID=A0ABT3E480_9LACO|nr:ATP-binding protein [Weissella ceti]MCW0953216.1 ATP-binding protein [Weissella ceti]QVK12732.1 ATP-binding protein [Weissella ceti]